ncbi:GDH/6PGL endoplasmic bifunctional protein [Trichoplax sp. H2]|nr:GDH/6PGL endoplasmic bifunctional protein [Trichoplax sp. H2]|eukprot:RDD41795.1 GDH/6PGL endoplasmic bifunctional protein [Trichoplax sp. H2]
MTNSSIIVRHRNIFLWLFISACLIKVSSSTEKASRTNVVLVGATGNLAQKYLWKSLFNLYKSINQSEEKYQLKFYGAARNPAHEGDKLLNQILGNIFQFDKSGEDEKVQKFLSNCQYVQLKSEKDYANLCKKINHEAMKESILEYGRIFYLSVPPFAYSRIASYISNHCRPDQESKTWIRVVFEKPFGQDLQTSKDLTNELQRYFDEHQIYLVDHYLGKVGVDQILQFRMENLPLYEPLWNRDYISRIEIVMKEEENCAERTEFYNSYGVIRDVMQNHLTEILALVCMELPGHQMAYNPSDLLQLKADLLEKVKNLGPDNVIVGQYKDYISHLRQDFKDITKRSNASTFAAVLLQVDNSRWRDVPIIMVAGKELTERTAYVRVVFKDGLYCLNNEVNCPTAEVIFNIQGGSLGISAEVTSKLLPRPILRPDWYSTNPTINSGDSLGVRISDYYVRSPKINPDAYTVVVDAVFKGRQDMFISTKNLILSWTLWTPLVHHADVIIPRLYDKDDNSQTLRFIFHKDQIAFADRFTYDCKNRVKNLYSKDGNHPFDIINQGFRNQTLIRGSPDAVIDNLVNDILLSATVAIRDRNVFHIAFPGGSTPIPLFQKLASLGSRISWSKWHIWIVDERCVPVLDSRSNFKSLHDHLLRYIDVPYYNIHPAIANQHAGFCDSSYYEQEIRSVMNESIFDYIVLGVGSDGHIASLFPGFLHTIEANNFVALVKKDYADSARITMTFSLLNKARTISALILGKRKQVIVSAIKSGIIDIHRYPVTGIKISDDRFKWFIDYVALP